MTRFKRFDKSPAFSYYSGSMRDAPIILASTSPRRRELIKLFGIDFQFLSVDVDETPNPGEAPEELVVRLSRAKADLGWRAANHPAATIVAADTDVSVAGAILGKPKDLADATRMLELLRGRAHTVFSGVTVANGTRKLTQVASTTVWMRDYTDPEIAAYVSTGDPLDKAAAYAIQHNGFRPVDRIEGCYANVMGLALCHLYRALRTFGVPIAEPDRACQEYLQISCPVAREILETWTFSPH